MNQTETPHTAASRVESMLVVFSRLGEDIVLRYGTKRRKRHITLKQVKQTGAQCRTNTRMSGKIGQAKLREIQQHILCWATDQKDPRKGADTIQACHVAAEQALAN